jgi:hypothetical protein
MSLFFKDLKIFILYFLFNETYDRVFFIEKKNYLKDFNIFLKNQNLNNKKIIIISFEDLDQIILFNINVKVIKHKFIQNLIFQTLNSKHIYASTPDLDYSIFVRNKKKSSKYFYIQHSPVGLLNAYKDHAFINFDLIFCNNVFQKKDLIKINNFFGKKIKSWKQKILIEKINIKNNIKKKILIAPTWSTNFYDEQIIQHLNKLNNNFDVTFRPHFMSLKNNKFLENSLNKNFNLDQSTQFNLLDYDLLISDWSGIYLEYLIHLRKKPILINTNEKIRNKTIKTELSIEKKLRKEFSYQLNLTELNKIEQTVLLATEDKNIVSLNSLRNIFYI